MPAKGLQLLCFVAALATASASVSAEDASLLGGGDLRSLVLSPTPIGPPSRFEPPPSVAAKAETFAAKPEARAESTPATKVTKTKPAPPPKLANRPSRQKAAAAVRKPKPSPSPLESYARDARRQTWPCVGGGICNWTQPPQ